MKRKKRVNRGAIIFIAVAVLLAVMITWEAVSVNAQTNAVYDVIESFVNDEYNYYILPENLRGNDVDLDAVEEYAKSARDLIEKYMYKKSVAGMDVLINNRVTHITDNLYQQILDGNYIDSLESHIYKDIGGTSIEFNANMTEVSAMVYLRENISVTVNGVTVTREQIFNCSFELVRDGGQWYILNASDILWYSAISGK